MELKTRAQRKPAIRAFTGNCDQDSLWSPKPEVCEVGTLLPENNCVKHVYSLQRLNVNLQGDWQGSCQKADPRNSLISMQRHKQSSCPASSGDCNASPKGRGAGTEIPGDPAEWSRTTLPKLIQARGEAGSKQKVVSGQFCAEMHRSKSIWKTTSNVRGDFSGRYSYNFSWFSSFSHHELADFLNERLRSAQQEEKVYLKMKHRQQAPHTLGSHSGLCRRRAHAVPSTHHALAPSGPPPRPVLLEEPPLLQAPALASHQARVS